jgi:signal transduction histidine kinase
VSLAGSLPPGAAIEPAPLQQLIGGLPQGPLAVLGDVALSGAGLALAIGTIHLARLVVRLHGIVARVMLAMTETQAQLAAAQAEATRQQSRAERSEQSRRELIVNVSHELRTPIASIKGHVESMLEPDSAEPSQADQRRYLEVVRKETERLASLVDDLLVVARSDSGELRADIRPVDVGQVARHVHGTLAPIAERDRRVRLVCEVEPGLRMALADEARLQQVMMNLVRNAITHTPAGGIVSVEAAAEGPDRVRLAVADTGVGIPPADLERIFDRFYRTDTSRSRATGGFGLGLGISRDLLQAMGGTIEVESEEGTGSRFTVRLRAA